MRISLWRPRADQPSAALRRTRRPVARARHSYRPRVELLEQRFAPVTRVWDGGGDGMTWSQVANWVGDMLPTTDDDAEIGPAFSGATITSSGVVTIRSVTSAASLQITGGTFSIAQASAINNSFMLSGGTVGGAGNLTVTGSLTWTGGRMAGPGQTLANGGLTLNAPLASYLDLDGRTLISNSDTAFIGGADSYLYGRNNAVFTNAAGRTFDIQGSAYLYPSAATFNNQGTLRKSAGSEASIQVGFAFNNTGTVEALSGTLNFTNGGISSGSLAVAAGATLRFSSGTYAVSGSITGAGTVRFSSGTVNLTGMYNVTGATQAIGGTVNFNAAATLGSLALSAGTLGGSGTVTVTGSLTWTGGRMAGPGQTLANGGLTLNAPSPPTWTWTAAP